MPTLSNQLVSNKFLQFGTSLIALAASIAMLYFGRDFLVTLIISAVFACILDPAVLIVMRLRVPRGAATPIVIGIAFVGVYLLGLLIWTQVATFSEDLPTYTNRLSEIVDRVNADLDRVEQQTIAAVVPKSLQRQQEEIQQKPQEAMKARRRRAAPVTPAAAQPAAPVIQEVRIHAEPKPVIATVYGYTSRYFHFLVMASFVPFLVYFMLSWRDRIGASILGLFSGEQRYFVGRAWVAIGESTRAYVLGNFFLWVFVSSGSAIIFFFLGVPYWAVVGPLSGIFSLIPYVGLPLSVLPPLLATLAVPNKFKVVLMVLVFTALMHVVAMNFLYAKIIGRRVRLNPLVVTIALMFWGVVWGGIGLILAVPITAALKSVCDNVEPLQGYGKLLGD